MLSDAAYGAIVSIACGVLILKFPRMSEGMKKSDSVIFLVRIINIILGNHVWRNFGDVINVVSRTFFGHEVGIKALWFVPLNNPMKLLIYSMVFGLIHLFTGLGIKGYMCIRDKKYVDFLCRRSIVVCFLNRIDFVINSDRYFCIYCTGSDYISTGCQCNCKMGVHPRSGGYCVDVRQSK